MHIEQAQHSQPSKVPNSSYMADMCPRGAKYRLSLVESDVRLPLIVVAGAQPGETLVVTAAVHGDEFEGVRAIFEIADELDPSHMTGNLLAVPVVNEPAFWAGTRRSPLDQADLARMFPGKPDGNHSEKTAFLLGEHIIAQASLYLDLHSGGVMYRMPAMVGCNQNDRRSCEAAEAFGSAVIWSHDQVPEGRTISFAGSRGIPWLYTEARGGGRIHTADLQMMKQGILNLLRHLHILTGMPEQPVSPVRLKGAGNTDDGVSASAAGFLSPHVSLMQPVKQGDSLGVLLDIWGQVTEEYRSPSDGVVALIHEFSVVSKGATLFLIASVG